MTDGAEDDARLHRLLGGESIAWLVLRARDRLETGRPLTGTVTLADATAEQRRAVERLTGRPARAGASLSVALPEVDRIVRDSGAAADGLAGAVARLTGPLRDRNRDRADTAAAWAAAFVSLDEAVTGRAELAAWRGWLDATGMVRRLAPAPDDALTLLEQVAAVLRRLPSRGMPIGRLAAECCGDAHALDDGRPAATLALSAARALAGLAFSGDAAGDSRRTAWAAVGVHCDDLSSLVLCYGLAGDNRTALGRVLALQREATQPALLTLRQLRCHDEPLRAAGLVRVCENPVVVAAAADELGGGCQPLVCVGGQPSAAGWRLLDLLAAGGAQFRYHGDFDWGGIRIATAVRMRTTRGQADWQSWRYDRAAYEVAAATVGEAFPAALLPRLPVGPVATPWDEGLAATMIRHGLRIEEELTLDNLLADLAELRPRLRAYTRPDRPSTADERTLSMPLPWSTELAGRIDEHVFSSDLLRGNPLGDPHERPLLVYTPPGYDDAQDRRYPAVYVIQGYTGHVAMWRGRSPFRQPFPETADAMFARGAAPPAIVVYVDAWTAYGGSQFVDSPGTGKYHSYLCDEVVPWVDAGYRTIPDAAHRAIAGKSSGGFGAMITPMLRPDLFGALATHAGDALYEYCYVPEFPQTVRELRAYDGDIFRWWDDFRSRVAFTKPEDMNLVALLGVAACFSARPDGTPELPFDPHTGVLRPDIWQRWLDWDPVRMVPRYCDALRSLRGIWIDAGTRDDFYLDIGASAFRAALASAGVADDAIHYELFEATHAAIDYRYPLSLAWLCQRMTP